MSSYDEDAKFGLAMRQREGSLRELLQRTVANQQQSRWRCAGGGPVLEKQAGTDRYRIAPNRGAAWRAQFGRAHVCSAHHREPSHLSAACQPLRGAHVAGVEQAPVEPGGRHA